MLVALLQITKLGAWPFFGHGYFHPHARLRTHAPACVLVQYFHPHVHVRAHTRAMTAIFPPSCVRAHMQAMRLESHSTLTRAPAIPVALAPAPRPPSSHVDMLVASPPRPAVDAPGCGLRILLDAAHSLGAEPAHRKPTPRDDGSRHSSCGVCAGPGAPHYPSWRSWYVALLSCDSVYEKCPALNGSPRGSAVDYCQPRRPV